MTKKRILAISLVMILAITSLSACGKEKEAEVPTTLTGKVNVAALEGAGTASCANLPGDYKVTKCATSGDIANSVLSGAFDVAIMSPTDAGKMNAKTSSNLVEISPITLGGLYVLQNNYIQRSRTLRVLNEKTRRYEYKTEKVETTMGYLRNQTIVAYGKKGDASEYILGKLLYSYAGRILGKNQIEWISDKDAFIKRLGNYQTIGLAYEPVASEAKKKNSSIKEVFNLNTKWKEKMGGDIPMDVLVANKDFVENRKDDLNIFLNDYAESIVKAKEDGKMKMVLYTESNRGINILKKFNKDMYEYDREAFGGKKPESGFYKE